MSVVGLGLPVLPLNGSGSLLKGEFHTYYNHHKPHELLVGSTSGGCTINVEREIHMLEQDGVYGPQLDANGVPCCRYDSCIIRITLNQLFLRYDNVKDISNCENDGAWESGDWSNNGGTYAAETSDFNSGSQSTKITADTEGHGGHEVFASDVDFTVLDNGEVSAATDYIGYAIKLSEQDLTDLGETAVIRLAFHCDAEETETNYFHVSKAQGDLTAGIWNRFKTAKSAFTSEGTPSWAAIKGVAATIEVASPDAEVVFGVDSIKLISAKDRSAPFPVKGSGLDVTANDGTKSVITPRLDINEADFIEDLTLVGEKLDGYMFKIKLLNCYADGNISAAFESKSDLVHETQFTAHYKTGSLTTPPLEMYEYYAA